LDANANNYLDWKATTATSMNELWNGGVAIPVGTVLDIYLTWNQWPVTDQDFDLDLFELVGSTWTYVTSAEDAQNGSQPPREHLHYTVTTAARYAVAIYKYSATTSPTFILRSYPHDLFYFGYNNYSVPVPGSICIPADAASVFSVGAIDYATYASGPIDPYSSLGPNNGAYTGNPTLTKPDICGPAGVTTVNYGTRNFFGTSASAPHLAGLAALVKQRYPAYTHSQLRSYIETNGIDLGATGKDNTYGAGPCVLPAALTGTPLQTWRQTYFGSTANSGNGADLDDFDKDSIPNLVEFALGTDPTRNSGDKLPKPERTGDTFSITVTQPGSVSGIIYGAEWSQTMLPGSWTDITDSGSGLQHVFSVPVAAGTNLYMRLKVTSP